MLGWLPDVLCPSGGHVLNVLADVSPDIHICGFCKQQFNNFDVFLAHKQNGCQIPSSNLSATHAGTSLTGKIIVWLNFACLAQEKHLSVMVWSTVAVNFSELKGCSTQVLLSEKFLFLTQLCSGGTRSWVSVSGSFLMDRTFHSGYYAESFPWHS